MPRNTTVPETRLVRRSQQGDRRAFRALLTRYDWRLRGLAHALLLEPGQVDAVLRVAYVKAWREVVRIDPREDAAAWLYRLVYNACIDGLRREGTRIASPSTAAQVSDAADAAGESPVQPGPAGHNGASSASADRHRARVVEALASLGPADRVAVVLVDREGFTTEAAARILGLTPDTVATRLASARARLVPQLADVVAAAPPPAEDSEARAADVEAQQEQQEAQLEAPEAQPDERETQPEQTEAQPEQTEAQPEEPDAETEEHDVGLDDTPADGAGTKVASRTAASGSPNGSSGAASTNGSDDSGGDGP